jgi:hypothetical protein
MRVTCRGGIAWQSKHQSLGSVRTTDMLCFWRLLPTSLLALVLMTASQITTWSAEAGNASKCDRSRFRVVVDVGHTVQAPGALSARGVPEYHFNLRLERRRGTVFYLSSLLPTTPWGTTGEQGARARPSHHALRRTTPRRSARSPAVYAIEIWGLAYAYLNRFGPLSRQRPESRAGARCRPRRLGATRPRQSLAAQD